MNRTIMISSPDEWTKEELIDYLIINNIYDDAEMLSRVSKATLIEKVTLFAEENEPHPLELVAWETVRADVGLPISDNNDGYIHGLYYMNLFTQCDIEEVEWFKTIEERQKTIDDGNYYIICNE